MIFDYDCRCPICNARARGVWPAFVEPEPDLSAYEIDVATHVAEPGDPWLASERAGRCAVCGATERLHLDHCHRTGRFRGQLCMHCNHALGKLGDDPERLQRMIKYLTAEGT